MSHSDLPLLWHYGFYYSTPRMLALARTIKANGPPPRQNPIYPDESLRPVPDDVDLGTPESRPPPEDMLEILDWATDFMEQYTSTLWIWKRKYPVIIPPAEDDCLALSFHTVRAWHLAELEANRDNVLRSLPNPNDAERIINMEKLLGPPQWYLDLRDAAEHNVLDEAFDGKFHSPTTAPSLSAVPRPQSHSEDALAEGVSSLTVSEAPDASGA
ncbi:hypothetical protein C8Q77DRAFT_1073056 [Trametes polyzona]|nr:hypothetical protein C8Q77DRAFT_1073056 [Trametes polyzona]